MAIVWQSVISFVSGIGGALIMAVFFRKRLEAYLDSYLGEKAKNLARKEDIDWLKKEVQILTKESETIRAEISDKMWDRQMRWNYKRDQYAAVLRALSKLTFAEVRMATRLHDLDADPDSTHHKHWLEKLLEASKQRTEAIDEFRAAAALVPVIACDDAAAIIERVNREFQSVGTPKADRQASKANLKLLDESLRGLVRHRKQT